MVSELLVQVQPDLRDMSEWSGVSEKVWGIMVSPPSSSTMSSRGYTSAWKKINLLYFFHFPSLPHLLRLPSFAFQRGTPSKRNDGNLHIYKQKHTLNCFKFYLCISMSIITSMSVHMLLLAECNGPNIPYSVEKDK